MDIFATRGRDRLIVQLKSTLRPESPWEVSKRNDDVLNGIDQAHRARGQLGEDVTALVVTDGYRGDFATWRVALERRVAVGTLADLDAIGREPAGAFEIAAQGVGFGGDSVGDDGSPVSMSRSRQRSAICSSVAPDGVEAHDEVRTERWRQGLKDGLLLIGHEVRDGPRGFLEGHSFSDAHHGFVTPDNEGYQPHDADRVWPLVTRFLSRVV